MPDNPGWFYSLLRRLSRSKRPKAKPEMKIGPGYALKNVLDADRRLIDDSQRAARAREDASIQSASSNVILTNQLTLFPHGEWGRFDDQELRCNDDTHVSRASATCASTVTEDRSESVSARYDSDPVSSSSSNDSYSSDSGSSSPSNNCD